MRLIKKSKNFFGRDYTTYIAYAPSLKKRLPLTLSGVYLADKNYVDVPFVWVSRFDYPVQKKDVEDKFQDVLRELAYRGDIYDKYNHQVSSFDYKSHRIYFVNVSENILDAAIDRGRKNAQKIIDNIKRLPLFIETRELLKGQIRAVEVSKEYYKLAVRIRSKRERSEKMPVRYNSR